MTDKDEICPLCNHTLTNNDHGLDQNDAYLNENDEFIHSGRCTYCKICNPRDKRVRKE